jgi:rod shape-determining protein MreC
MKFDSKIKTAVIIILIFGFFIVLNQTFIGDYIKVFFYNISAPFQRSLWGLGIQASNFFEMIFEMKSLKKENESLKSRILELENKDVLMEELRKENEALRKALEIDLRKDFELELAGVISKDISQDFFLIDKGKKDGLEKNLPVITEEKFLVGKIFEVYENSSKVILISNKLSSLSAEIPEREIEGILKGKGGFEISFELIPKEKEIQQGDLVLTSPLTKDYPSGLLIGQVEEVKSQDVEPFQTAKIKSAFDIGILDYLFIITAF